MTKKVAGNGQEKTEKNPIGSGPPLKPLVWAVIARMCADHATEEEICRWLGISADCLLDRCKGRWGMTFKEYYNENQAGGKISLRRQMHKSAEGIDPIILREKDGKIVRDGKGNPVIVPGQAPNVAAQIFLMKNECGYADKHEFTGRGGGPIEIKEIHVNLSS